MNDPVKSDCVPLKLGLKVSGPVLVLLYQDNAASGLFTNKRNNVLRQRTMPIRELNTKSDCSEVASRLRKRHQKYLGPVSNVRVERVLRVCQLTMSGHKLTEAVAVAEAEFEVDPSEDMNALSDKDLKRRKELMDLAFEKNQVKVGDPSFIYDKQVQIFSDIDNWLCSDLHATNLPLRLHYLLPYVQTFLKKTKYFLG